MDEKDSKKICILCKEEKDLSGFYKHKTSFSSRCKICFSDYQKNNKNRKANQDRYRFKNQDKIKEKNRCNYYKDLESTRKKKAAEAMRRRQANPERSRKEYIRNNNLRKLHPKKCLEKRLRDRFFSAVTSRYKQSSAISLLGCSIDEFYIFLESKFTEGMTWENRGRKGWHIDHILPCCSFDLTKPEEQAKCFHYTNLQPLWWYDNFSKGSKILNP